jgi:hypothetical protein
MENALRAAIERQAKKLIERHKKNQFTSKKYERRFRLRTGHQAIPASIRDPGIWNTAPHFDPAYCIKHSKYLANTIWRKITSRDYQPSPAVLFKIPKDSGGHREIMVFSIPDAAVANLFNARMRDRNRNIQSLVTHVEQLAMLDGWLISALRRATRERRRILANTFGAPMPSLTEVQLIVGDWYKFQTGIQLETGAPSFVLAWRAARKAFRQYGLTDFATPTYYSTLFNGY